MIQIHIRPKSFSRIQIQYIWFHREHRLWQSVWVLNSLSLAFKIIRLTVREAGSVLVSPGLHQGLARQEEDNITRPCLKYVEPACHHHAQLLQI